MIISGKRISEMDVNSLIGAELMNISFSQHLIILHFQENIEISAEDELIFVDIENNEFRIKEGYLEATLICKLLYSSIKSAILDTNENLILEFSNGFKLILLKLTDPESFTVGIGKEVYVS